MVDVSSVLGGFLPGSEPKYLVPGSALHICGTYRAGASKKDRRGGQVFSCLGSRRPGFGWVRCYTYPERLQSDIDGCVLCNSCNRAFALVDAEGRGQSEKESEDDLVT